MFRQFISNFILFSFLILVTNTSYADLKLSGPKVAKIIVPRAVVYADENLLTPLGYISNGKQIAVGTPKKMLTKEIVPTIVSGRLAYVELSDVEFEDEDLNNKNSKTGQLREHNVDIVLTKPEEKLNENNSAFFQISRFGSGAELQSTMINLEGKDVSWFTSLDLFFIHRIPLSKYSYGVGFEYDYLSNADAKISIFMMKPQLGLNVLRNNIFLLDAFCSLDFSTSASSRVDNNYSNDPAGFIFGPQLGVRAISSESTKYRMFGTLSYRQYKAYGFTLFKKINANDYTLEDNVTGFSTISGINIGAGVTFDL